MGALDVHGSSDRLRNQPSMNGRYLITWYAVTPGRRLTSCRPKYLKMNRAPKRLLLLARGLVVAASCLILRNIVNLFVMLHVGLLPSRLFPFGLPLLKPL